MYKRQEILHIAVLFQDDFFPVPLIHVDGVDIVGVLIPADGAHVSIETLADVEDVYKRQRIGSIGNQDREADPFMNMERLLCV